jgi:ABC-type multidrug transport system ATPase subunit
MIEVKKLSKSYGEKNQKILAVDNISFSVEKGEIFGLIGPDGSGKPLFLECSPLFFSPILEMQKLMD